MNKLADYQRALMGALLDPDKPLSDLQAVMAGENDLSERLAIYQNSVLGGRFTVLQQIFVCVEKIVGAEYFQQMAEQFLVETPSNNVVISAMGAGFVAYVTTHEVVQHVPYIVDMAQLDWRWYQVFHGRSNRARADNAVPLGARWTLPLDAQLLKSTFPLHLLWEMCQPEYQGEFQLPDGDGTYYFIIIQRAQSIHIELLSEAQWQVLHQLPIEANNPLIDVLWQQGCIVQAEV